MGIGRITKLRKENVATNFPCEYSPLDNDEENFCLCTRIVGRTRQNLEWNGKNRKKTVLKLFDICVIRKEAEAIQMKTNTKKVLIGIPIRSARKTRYVIHVSKLLFGPLESQTISYERIQLSNEFRYRHRETYTTTSPERHTTLLPVIVYHSILSDNIQSQ